MTDIVDLLSNQVFDQVFAKYNRFPMDQLEVFSRIIVDDYLTNNTDIVIDDFSLYSLVIDDTIDKGIQ